MNNLRPPIEENNSAGIHFQNRTRKTNTLASTGAKAQFQKNLLFRRRWYDNTYLLGIPKKLIII